MSHKLLREEGKTSASKNLPVTSKCLAIVLISKTRKGSAGYVLDNNIAANAEDADETIVDSVDGNVIVQSSEVQKALSPSGYNGKELLQDFKIRNKTCYWNPSLVESIKSLEYKGFVEPCTILVTGADIHLENLRSAWGRRVLKAPAGFIIERIGDVNGIQMQVIPQTQFTPLPDALCSVIMELNTRRVVATMDVILEKLAAGFTDMTPPSQQLIFDTISTLIRDRKLFHTGSGYFVVTPDTSRLQQGDTTTSSFIPTNASWLPYHPMYVPVFQGQNGAPPLPALRVPMRSISCQVTTIEESDDSEDEKVISGGKAGTAIKPSRSNSLGRNKQAKADKETKGSKGEKVEAVGEFKRSSSLKHKGDKGKASKEVAAPLSKPDHGLEKGKGEKVSLFSKIFGRNKKKSQAAELMPPPPPPPLPKHPTVQPSVSSSETASEGKGMKSKDYATLGKGKEYATFSAQFPPPEWLWYQQQLEKQRRTESWVTLQLEKVTTASTVSKVTSRPPLGSKSHAISARKSLHPQPLVDYMPMSAMGSHGEPKKSALQPPPPVGEYDGKFIKPQQTIRADNFYESYRHPSHSKHRHHNHRKSRELDKLVEESRHHRTKASDYAVIDQADVTPAQDSNVYHSVSALSPVAHLSDESTYAKLVEQPKLGPLHSTPRYESSQRHTDRNSYGVEGHEARDRIYGPPDISHKRKSHRPRRRAHRAYSYYGQGDDISIEYKGRLPNKNSSRAQSRDSGVNCVGLGIKEDKDKRHTGPVYENTPASGSKQPSQTHHDRLQPRTSNAQREHQPSGNRVHFEVNNTIASESTLGNQQLCVTDPAANSVAYQSSIMDPAYNSVVYASSVTDMVGGPSVVYHTIIDSALEASGMPVPHQSLQSAFYEDNSVVPASNVITCHVEINPQAPTETEEINHSPVSEEVDVVGSPGSRQEVLGASDEVVELAVEEEAEGLLRAEVVGGDGIKEKHGASDEHEVLTASPVGEESIREVQGIDSQCEGGVSKPQLKNNGDTVAKDCSQSEHRQVADGRQGCVVNGVTDVFVSDSGFSSPRNQDVPGPDRNVQSSEQSHSASEQSDSQNPHGSGSDGTQLHQESSTTDSIRSNAHQHHSGETTSSDGHHTNNSDVNMASGTDHHSSSTNETGDQSNGHTESPNVFPLPNRVKHSLSSHSIPSSIPPILQQQQHHYSQQIQSQNEYLPSAAKIVTHPDVYNNNTANVVYVEQGRSVRVPLHPNTLLNNQRPPTSKSKRTERPRSDIWKNNMPNNLHRFEEEQRALKYGVNGEFEVMGVL